MEQLLHTIQQHNTTAMAQCKVCFEETQNPRIIGDSPVCVDCVKEGVLPLFTNALKFEYHYPPKWGSKRLEIDDFADQLGEDFVQRYRRREEEYQVSTPDYDDAVKDLPGQVRGRDLQQCPRSGCGNIVSLLSGCNNLTCNKCDTSFCMICGEPAESTSDHWAFGRPCPRWNQPDAENAQHDELEDDEGNEDINFEGERWEPILLRLRFIIMHRREEGGSLDREWVLQVLRNMADLIDLNEMELVDFAVHFFGQLSEVQRRPRRIPGEIIPIASQQGIDEVAMRTLAFLQVHGDTAFGQPWYEQLVQDLEHRQLIEGELMDLRERLAPTMLAIMEDEDDGLFEMMTNAASQEVSDWAFVRGYDLDDEPVVRLLRMYDDMTVNIELAGHLLGTDPDDSREYRERHASIQRTAHDVEMDMRDGMLPELQELYDDYTGMIPL